MAYAQQIFKVKLYDARVRTYDAPRFAKSVTVFMDRAVVTIPSVPPVTNIYIRLSACWRKGLKDVAVILCVTIALMVRWVVNKRYQSDITVFELQYRWLCEGRKPFYCNDNCTVLFRPLTKVPYNMNTGLILGISSILKKAQSCFQDLYAVCITAMYVIIAGHQIMPIH